MSIYSSSSSPIRIRFGADRGVTSDDIDKVLRPVLRYDASGRADDKLNHRIFSKIWVNSEKFARSCCRPPILGQGSGRAVKRSQEHALGARLPDRRHTGRGGTV